MSSKNNKFSKILSKNYLASANALFFRGSLDKDLQVLDSHE